MYEAPPEFDSWGWSAHGQQWTYDFCVMDDYGTAVPIDPFNHYSEGCVQIMAPDRRIMPGVGEPYPYALFTPNVH